MKRNMGTLDRVVRAFVVAPALVVAAVVIGLVGVVSIVLYALAAVMLATSAVGFCPLSPLLHVTTCPHNAALVGARATVGRLRDPDSVPTWGEPAVRTSWSVWLEMRPAT